MKKEVVHVPTRELAEEVLRVAKENGFKEPSFKSEHYFKIGKEKLCFRFNEVYFSFARISFYKEEGYSIITAEEFLNRYEPRFRPIAMKCSQEQFEAVKGKLVGCRIGFINDFNNNAYLVNNYGGYELRLTNVRNQTKSNLNRQVFEEWDEKTFLEYCGIEVKDEVNELERLRKENESLKKQLKAIQDQPKVGDVCLFWEGPQGTFITSILTDIDYKSKYTYICDYGSYKNCIKATDENIKSKIKELQDDIKTT